MEGTSAGIDWASEEHALCVVDAAGRKLAGELFSHDEAGLRELIARMRALGVCRVAIERPDGLLVDRLLDAGFAILPVHPNALKATRPRFEAGGGDLLRRRLGDRARLPGALSLFRRCAGARGQAP
jgi:hypothetical protein